MDLFTSMSRRLVAGVIMSIACALAYADNPDGTYRLVTRTLSDGTVQIGRASCRERVYSSV